MTRCWGIWCETWAGTFLVRYGWMRERGRIARYSDHEEAETVAQARRDKPNRSTVTFLYTVQEIGPEGEGDDL